MDAFITSKHVKFQCGSFWKFSMDSGHCYTVRGVEGPSPCEYQM